MSRKKLTILKIHPTLHVVGAVLLFLVSVVASQRAELLAWEESLFLWIYNWPEFLRPFFIVITWFGSVQVFAIFVLVLVLKI